MTSFLQQQLRPCASVQRDRIEPAYRIDSRSRLLPSRIWLLAGVQAANLSKSLHTLPPSRLFTTTDVGQEGTYGARMLIGINFAVSQSLTTSIGHRCAREA